MSVCHLVGEMLLAVDSKYFKANLLNPLKDYLESALQNSVPEFIQLILTIRKKHAVDKFDVCFDLIDFSQCCMKKFHFFTKTEAANLRWKTWKRS